jgi:hypothetical protein
MFMIPAAVAKCRAMVDELRGQIVFFERAAGGLVA